MNGLQNEHIPLNLFHGKKILITSGAGYLASGLVEMLKNIDCHIIRMHRQGSSPAPVTGAMKIMDLAVDVRDPLVWEQSLTGVDYIFHFAAQTSTYVADADPVADQAANVWPILHMLESCRRQELHPAVCFSSTVTVAGIPVHLPVDESHPDHPLTAYDLHKLMAEQYLRWYSEQGYVKGVTLRLSNVYGPGPRSRRTDRAILNQMIRRSLTGEALTVYGEGGRVRDYLYIEDAVSAFLSAALHSEELNGKCYVIGSGRGHTIAEAMGLVSDLAGARTGIPVPVQHVAPPENLSPIEERDFVADSSRFSKATGWEARHTLAKGIELTLEALL